MKKKPADKPKADVAWVKVALPKPIHKRLAHAAVDAEITIPKLVTAILDKQLPKYAE